VGLLVEWHVRHPAAWVVRCHQAAIPERDDQLA